MDHLKLYRRDYIVGNETEKEYAEEYEEEEVEKGFIVDWEPEDEAMEPYNWSNLKRLYCTCLLVFIAMVTTGASSISAGTYEAVAEDFGVTMEVSEMSTSLYLVGFGVGSPVLAPLCEEVGRLHVYVFSTLFFALFQIGAATSNNMAALGICRFFAGFFGTTPLSNAGGSIADIYPAKPRTIMFPFYSCFAFVGTALFPVIGAYLSITYLGWRWAHYLCAILGFAISLVSVLTMPETYRATIMDLKAASIRKKTQDKRYRSLHEIKRGGKSPLSPDVFARPFYFAITEPIVGCFTCCITIAYIVLFSDFEAFTVIFGTWGFSSAKSTLPFISVSIGILINFLVVSPIAYFFFLKKSKEENGQEASKPESRLVAMMICTWFIPISLFWLAWTTYKRISPWSSIVSTAFFGFGFIQVFITSYVYVIDSYGSNAASALATLTLVRYLISGGIIHIANPMYKNLGVHWALSLLAFISLIICVMPFIFYKFGHFIRSKSKFTII